MDDDNISRNSPKELFKQAGAALPSLKNLRGSAMTPQGRVNLAKATLATQRATIMYACYRRDDAANPEIFLDAAAAILASYPDDCIMWVTDPRTGIPGTLKWPPQPSEVKEACEDYMAPLRRREERELSLKRQLAERAELERQEANRPDRLTIEELKAKYGETWGLNPREEVVAANQEQRDRARQRLERDIQAEYEAHGEEPVRAGELLISRELANKLRGYR